MDTGYGKQYGLCSLCQDESKKLPISEWVCDDCKRDYADGISTGEAWITEAKTFEVNQRKRERRESYHVPMRIDDESVQTLPAFIRTAADSLQPGTLDYFMEKIDPLRSAWLEFDRHQVPGFSFSKFGDAQYIMALVVNIIMLSKVEHGEIAPEQATPEAATKVLNIVRALYRLDDISSRRYQQLKKEAEQKIKVFKRTGHIQGSVHLLKSRD